jgi:hypothetical protein
MPTRAVGFALAALGMFALLAMRRVAEFVTSSRNQDQKKPREFS